MRKLTYQEFEARATKLHKGKYKYFQDYVNCGKKIKIQCLECGRIFYQIAGNHLNGADCPDCAIQNNTKNRSLTYQEFEERETKRHKGKYRYYQDYVNNHTKIKITCLDCGLTFEQTPYNHSQGAGCANCAGNKHLTFQEVEEKVIKLYNGKYRYYHDYVNNKTKIRITCLDCGITFYQTPDNHSHGHGCPNCAASKNENLTGEFLRELFSNNIDEATFHNKTIIKLPSGKDAYIDFKFEVNGQVIFVEYNGQQHYKPTTFGGISLERATENFNNYQVPRDENLRAYCKLHGILLFEIDGRKYTNKKIRQYIIDQIIPNLPSSSESVPLTNMPLSPPSLPPSDPR